MFTDNLPLTIDQTSSLSDDNDFSISNDSSSPFSNTTAPSSSNSTEPEISNLTESLDDLDFVNEDLTIANRLFDNIFDSYLLGVILQNYRMAKTSCIKILEENITQNTSEASETSIKTYVSGLSSTTAAVFLLNFFPSETSQQSKPNRTNKKRDISNVDILGNSLASIRKIECVCPSCKRSLAASRLAPHLEKCMGMGRNASRVASKRIALFTKTLNGD
ncbi:PREDICTED: SAGA-associated factor 11 homolog [Rhagoletis zephyria]|uniref:SAGA-associated factor 11 homolog n=1 Tax=Rhagoletis zephyria TaxID=28612 RepID=UPI000811A2B7|nr:PREDICTED: SAGA-associated factor 11 homolog [Rhagoletis zephyria]